MFQSRPCIFWYFSRIAKVHEFSLPIKLGRQKNSPICSAVKQNEELSVDVQHRAESAC